jgi:hypothetical protein
MEEKRKKHALKYFLPFTGRRRSDRIKTVVELSAVVLAAAIAFALSFAGCKGTASPDRDTVWLSLRPITLDETDGVRTATLLLDFSAPIEGLDDKAEDLNQTFSFVSYGSAASESRAAKGILVTKVTRSTTGGGGYALTIENVPESGIVVVKLNKEGVTPPSRLWNVAGFEVFEDDLDITPALLDFRFLAADGTTTVGEPGSITPGSGSEPWTIAVTVPDEVNLTKLVPKILCNPMNIISPADDKEQDFTQPVTYRVMAEDGSSTKTYKVTVTKAASQDDGS